MHPLPLMRIASPFIPTWILVCGCGGSVASEPTSLGSTVQVTTPVVACGWPAALNATDAGGGQCVAYRAYLSCKESSGGTNCPSSDPIECVDNSAALACTDLCSGEEYAIGCGGPGPGPWPSPPTTCRLLPSGPAVDRLPAAPAVRALIQPRTCFLRFGAVGSLADRARTCPPPPS